MNYPKLHFLSPPLWRYVALVCCIFAGQFTSLHAEGVIGYTTREFTIPVYKKKGEVFNEVIKTGGNQFATFESSPSSVPANFNYALEFNGTFHYYGNIDKPGVYTFTFETLSMYIDWPRLFSLGSSVSPAPPGGPSYFGGLDFDDWFQDIWDPIKAAVNQIANIASQIANVTSDPWYRVTETVADAVSKIDAIYGDLENAPQAIRDLKNQMISEGQAFEDKVKGVCDKLGLTRNQVLTMLIKYAGQYAASMGYDINFVLSFLKDGKFDPRTIYGYWETFHFYVVISEDGDPLSFRPDNQLVFWNCGMPAPTFVDYVNSLGSPFASTIRFENTTPSVMGSPIQQTGPGVHCVSAMSSITVTPGVILQNGGPGSTLVLRCKAPSGVN